MRLLFVTSYLPGRGLHGGSSRIFEILRFLKEEGHTIFLISFSNKERGHDPERKIKRFVDYLKVFDEIPYLGKPDEDVSNYIKDLLSKKNFDLVQFEYVHTGEYFDSVGKGIPMVLTEHELFFKALMNRAEIEKNLIKKGYNYLKSHVMRRRELRVMRNMDRIICVSKLDAENLSEYIPSKKIEVIPHGVDVEFFSPLKDVEVERGSIGFFGYYKHYPNVDAVKYFVDRIFPIIKKDYPNLRFYIIGREPPDEIRKLEKIKGVTVTGFVKDLRYFLQRCEVIISPIKLGMGMRVKILEAMAMGKPIVATPLSCEGFEIMDGRHLLVASEPDTFAECVLYLLNDRKMAKRLGEEARKLVVEKYNYRVVGRKLEDLYERVVREKNIDKS